MERNGVVLHGNNLASALNIFYVSDNFYIPPLNMCSPPCFLSAKNDIPIIQPYKVFHKLRSLKTHKAVDADEIPNRFLNCLQRILKCKDIQK